MNCSVEDFSRTEIIEALKLMKWHKSSGAGVCGIDVFKGDCPDPLIDCLTLLFNKCNSEGIPDSWKNALLMPLYKKGDKRECSNYRGISLL